MNRKIENNVIPFPNRYNYDGVIKNPEIALDKINDMKTSAIFETLSALIPDIFTILETFGLDTQDDEYYKISFLILLLQNITNEHYGLSHPLTPFLKKYNKTIKKILEDSGFIFE